MKKKKRSPASVATVVALIVVIGAAIAFFVLRANPEDGGPDDAQPEIPSVAANAPESGIGWWMYGQYTYAGDFENHMPNGDGKLICQKSYGFLTIEGNWIDGLADGEIEVILEPYFDEGVEYYQLIYQFSVSEGRVPETISRISSETWSEWEIVPEFLFGVPPWYEFWIDPESLPAES